jgi:hypothetical protein
LREIGTWDKSGRRSCFGSTCFVDVCRSRPSEVHANQFHSILNNVVWCRNYVSSAVAPAGNHSKANVSTLRVHINFMEIFPMRPTKIGKEVWGGKGSNSMSLQAHFEFTSSLLRSHFDLTSMSLRFPLDFASISPVERSPYLRREAPT